MKMKTFVLCAFLAPAIFSCNSTSIDAEKTEDLKMLAPSSLNSIESEPEQTVMTDSTEVPTPKNIPGKAKQLPQYDWDKKIIKTATVKLEVASYKDYNTKIYEIVKGSGGYIAQENQNTNDFQMETVMSIKVPVAAFEELISQLSGNSKIIERKINTNDVTDQLVDTKSRLESRKQMRLKYLYFLQQAKNMEEALQVQKEVNSIQEEIESAAGRINYLSHQSAYSTIHLTYYQLVDGVKPPVDEAPSFITRTGNAFKYGAKWIGELFIGLVSVWPLLLIVIGAVLFWKRFLNSKKIVPQNS